MSLVKEYNSILKKILKISNIYLFKYIWPLRIRPRVSFFCWT